MRALYAIASAVVALALAGCAGGAGNATGGTAAGRPLAGAALYDPAHLPAGKMGALVREGYNIITQTHKFAKPFVVAQMQCSSCHIAGGTIPRGGYLRIAGHFPQWNKRSHRAIALQDRIAECFLYSMNGKPPAYDSRTMIAVVAYINWISRGQKTFSPIDPAVRIARIKPPAPPSISRGAKIYAAQCSICHQATGAGIPGQFPALWGATSFNKGAGMAKLAMMAGFVRYNMPLGKAGTLSNQQAYDVAAFVESHKRPAFDKKAAIAFPPEPASYF